MFRARPSLRTLRPKAAACPPRLRFYSSKPEDLPPPQTHSVQEGFAHGPIFVLNVAKKFIKFSTIGLVALGLSSALAFEGAHIWVENVEFALPKDDAETRKWEWNLERENWSGDIEAAGTDPALGLRGRHLLRAAWMAQNWGADQNTAIVSSDSVKSSDDTLLGPRGLIIIDPRLVRAEAFLRDAIAIAEQKSIDGKLRPWTMTQLLLLHASVLERMGPQSMINAKAQYERAWSSQPFISPQSARIALKVGDLNRRLGDDNIALAWWDRSIHLVHPNLGKTGFPAVMSSSPYAQRSLLYTLSSMSAFYATTGNLAQAQSIAEASLDLIRSVRQPDSITSISPPHSLHALTLLQRSSVFAIHLAEVLYAQKKPTITSTQWLTTAAESSQRVIRGLTGLPLNNLTVEQALAPPSASIDPSYLNYPSLKKPASSLHRDARRTAAEAWNLTGILLEGKNPRAAFAAYETAVHLAGSSEEHGKPADKTLQTDWEVIWGNYTRLKSKMKMKE